MYKYLKQILENHWYNQDSNIFIKWLLNILLVPFSMLFLFVYHIRYYLYKLNILKVHKLPIPVVVVGNISVGGVGKTPLTLHLATKLSLKQINVGVILRGYKGNATTPIICDKNSDVRIVGDEALLYANSDIPVCVFKNRYLAGLELIKTYPNLDIILMDDGLQHYSLYRNYEIVVVDTSRYYGNRYLLPNGPLRELVSRTNRANILVLNGNSVSHNIKQLANIRIPQIYQIISLKSIYNPVLNHYYSICELQNLDITVMVATGHPERFCQFLIEQGIKIKYRVFYPDHHYYHESDIPNNSDIILVTTKDYTKLSIFNHPKIAIVYIDTSLSSNQIFDDISVI
jgi:tetraacyldisaccharide 4'-kinase